VSKQKVSVDKGEKVDIFLFISDRIVLVLHKDVDMFQKRSESTLLGIFLVEYGNDWTPFYVFHVPKWFSELVTVLFCRG